MQTLTADQANRIQAAIARSEAALARFSVNNPMRATLEGIIARDSAYLARHGVSA